MKTIKIPLKEYNHLKQIAKSRYDIVGKIVKKLDTIKNKETKIKLLNDNNYWKKNIHNARRCRYCCEWYKDCLKYLVKVHSKKLRYKLKHLFETLWINNCGDFDIIYYEFISKLQ